MTQTSKEDTDQTKENKTPPSKVKSYFNKISVKLLNYREAFSKTKAGKALSIITSPGVSRVATIALAALTMAGIITTFTTPAAAIVFGTLSIAAVSVGAAASVYRTGAMRRLINEHDLLIKNRFAKNRQDNILTQNPKLAGILKDQLLQPSTDEKKSITKRYVKENTEKTLTVKTIAKSVLENGINFAELITSGISTGGKTLIVGIGLAAFDFVTDSKFKVDMEHVGHQLKKNIDIERAKNDTPGYNNLNELKSSVSEQYIQSQSLSALVNDPKYREMSESQISQRFNELKKDFSKYSDAEQLSKPEKALKTLKNIVQDVGRAHDPFSKYNNPDKIQGLTIPSQTTDSKHARFDEQTLKQSIKPLKEIMDSNQVKKNLPPERVHGKIKKQNSIVKS